MGEKRRGEAREGGRGGNKEGGKEERRQTVIDDLVRKASVNFS